MLHQLVSWLWAADALLSPINAILYHLRQILTNLAGIICALRVFVCAWRTMSRRVPRASREKR